LRESFRPEDIWVAVNNNHKQVARQILPEEFSTEHILTEPEKRDTFAAVVAHAALVSHHSSEEEPIIFLHADHLTLPETDSCKKQNEAIRRIGQSLNKAEFDLSVIGIQPTFAATQYGYIQLNPQDEDKYLEKVVPVASFKEKPDKTTAEEFVASGHYLWNFGAFSFKFGRLKEIINELYPDILPAIENIQQKGRIELDDFRQLPKIAFDYAILEKVEHLGVIGIDFEVWEDIGTWETLANYLPELDENPNHVQFSGENNKVKTIHPQKKVAFVGVSNLLLVETEEGLLVADPSHTSEIRKVTEWSEGG
jgi:mannose-1-phosphate guanylyltransferase